MDASLLFLFLVFTSLAFYMLGRLRSLQIAAQQGGLTKLNSLPFYYGMHTMMWAAIPALALYSLWFLFSEQIIKMLVIGYLPSEYVDATDTDINLVLNKVYNVAYGQDFGSAPYFIINAANQVLKFELYSKWLATGLVAIALAIGGGLAWLRINPGLKARSFVEYVFKCMLMICASVAVLTTVGIVLSVIAESVQFFQLVPVSEFLFGTQWNPQVSLHDEQVMGESRFGMLPLFAGTLYIAGIAMVVAVPVGLMTAIYLSEYSISRVRNIFKPLIEILAGIPTVVYGFFAALTVAPMIRDLAIFLGLDNTIVVTSESTLAVGLVMGVMIIPFVSSLSDDVINAVPQSMRDGALALGATHSEMIRQIVIPAALPGIVSGVLLAASRAIGETMIVVMAAGLAAKMTLNPLDSMSTVTVHIVTMLVGDQEFDSPKTLAAFALGLMLFTVTLLLNYIALYVVRKYSEQYE